MNPLQVLCVDDELGMRLAVERTLEEYTLRLPEQNEEILFEVSLAETGEEALQTIEASPPDILLLDYKLPGITGLDVLRKLEEKRCETVTIMITAYASIETAVQATKHGAFDFIAKPFTPEELKTILLKATKQCLLQRQARQSAQERRQARFQMISVVAHELKAPLNAIEGNLDIVRKRQAGKQPEVYERLIERCVVRVQGMRKLIIDLLDLTRIESGTRKRELRSVDLQAIAHDALEAAQSQADLRQITLNLNISEPLHFEADRREMEIILKNLVNNAVKYNRDGGNVEVRLGREGDLVGIEVTDTGIGLTKEEAGRLFQDFTRIRNDKTKDILGSGLGLSIVRKIARLYGGDVSVWSEPDVGSTFKVFLTPGADIESLQEKLT